MGLVGEPTDDLELHFNYDDLSPVVGAPYKVTFDDGTVLQGALDASGYKMLRAVPKGGYTIEYGEDAREWAAPPRAPDDAAYRKSEVQSAGRAAIDRMLVNEPTRVTARGVA